MVGLRQCRKHLGLDAFQRQGLGKIFIDAGKLFQRNGIAAQSGQAGIHRGVILNRPVRQKAFQDVLDGGSRSHIALPAPDRLSGPIAAHTQAPGH